MIQPQINRLKILDVLERLEQLLGRIARDHEFEI